MRTVNLNAAYFPAIEFISAVATVVVLLYGGNQVLDGAIKVGVLVGFLTALSNFFNPITQLSQLYTTYQAGMAALDKIFELLDEQPEMVERPGAQELERIRGELVFDHVSFSYPQRDGRAVRLALDDIDLQIAPGETVALVGATGAGKSTFAKLVARFYDPTAGRVLIDGQDIRDVTFASLRSQLGSCRRRRSCSPARSGPTSPSAGPTRATAEVEEAARAIGAHDFIAALEHGYDTEVGERGVALSAGQRQLVAFARAMIADPRILVLDEATSNVDVHTEMRIERGLRRLLAGRTAIVIAHRLSTIAGATPDRRAGARADRRTGHARGARGRRRRLRAAVPRLVQGADRGVGARVVAMARRRWLARPRSGRRSACSRWRDCAGARGLRAGDLYSGGRRGLSAADAGWCNRQHVWLWTRNLGFESLSRSRSITGRGPGVAGPAPCAPSSA